MKMDLPNDRARLIAGEDCKHGWGEEKGRCGMGNLSESSSSRAVGTPVGRRQEKEEQWQQQVCTY